MSGLLSWSMQDYQSMVIVLESHVSGDVLSYSLSGASLCCLMALHMLVVVLALFQRAESLRFHLPSS